MPGRTPDPEPLVPEGCAWPVVVGIDPGTIVSGYAALVVAPDGPRLLVCGTWRAPRGHETARRLLRMREGLEELLARCRPSAVVVERAYAARNVQSALRIGEARGLALAAAAAVDAEVVELTPAEAKRALVGNGQAAKEQVAAMARRLFVRDERAELPLDASDAIALAYAHAKGLALRTAVQGALAHARPSADNGDDGDAGSAPPRPAPGADAG